MSHVTCTQGNWVESQLLVVGSQTVNLTPDLSFGHNLCFRCPNGQPLALVASPRLRLQHSLPLEEEVNVFIDIYKLFPQCNCFPLDPWPSSADLYSMTLPQANLGCRNPSLGGSRPRQGGCKVVGQEGDS
jgi:hypothetical protein